MLALVSACSLRFCWIIGSSVLKMAKPPKLAWRGEACGAPGGGTGQLWISHWISSSWSDMVVME